jgi:hypothetical protein
VGHPPNTLVDRYREAIKMTREEMLEIIQDRLQVADEYTIEQIYDFLQEVEY